MAEYLKVSAIRKFIKAKSKRCSKDFIEELDNEVLKLVNLSITRCKAMTLKSLNQEA